MVMKLSPLDCKGSMVEPAARLARFSIAVLALLCLFSSGCEVEHGKGGFIDRAMAEDLRQQGSVETCTDGKRWLPHKPSARKCATNDPRPACTPGCYGSDE
jgi:hypothetical protein